VANNHANIGSVPRAQRSGHSSRRKFDMFTYLSAPWGIGCVRGVSIEKIRSEGKSAAKDKAGTKASQLLKARDLIVRLVILAFRGKKSLGQTPSPKRVIVSFTRCTPASTSLRT